MRVLPILWGPITARACPVTALASVIAGLDEVRQLKLSRCMISGSRRAWAWMDVFQVAETYIG